MVTSERTQCLPSPKNTTAFTAPISKSTSSKPRRRTKIISPASGGRMTLSTFIYISLAVITLTLSPSAYAEPINVTVNSEATAPDFLGYRVYKKFVAREKRIELICTAHVPDASMNWYRVLDNREEEDMKLQVCIGPDVELTDRKKPPEHCKVTYDVGRNTTVLRLEIKRVRKEGNETLKTISDFRKYVCRVGKNGQQDEKGGVVVELVERVSATRSFGHRGLQSLTVVQGEELKIYCDIHGVDPKDFKNGNTKVVWMKDGQVLNIEETPDNDIKKFERVEKDEKGSPYRVGFSYLLADTEHRGNYRCDVIKEGERNQDPDNQNAGDGFATLTYYVRVKDKLGALWPFLGICGEVVILCTIILIYEKRRSKAELEESDTDGSPDQNNSNSND